jgi:hypothetical protein
MEMPTVIPPLPHRYTYNSCTFIFNQRWERNLETQCLSQANCKIRGYFYHIYIKKRRVVQLIQVLRHRIAPFRLLHGYDGIIRSYSLIPQFPGLFPGAASPAYALMSTHIQFKIC